MKRYLVVFAVLLACTPAVTTTTTTPAPTPPPPPPAPAPRTSGTQLSGAPTAQAAVQQFLNAVRAQDLQAMALVFGTARGPSRDNIERSELEKRLIILQCYFKHDKFRILGETPGEGGHRVIATELTRGRIIRSPRFYAIPGPGRRWYVDNMEIAVVQDFCRR